MTSGGATTTRENPDGGPESTTASSESARSLDRPGWLLGSERRRRALVLTCCLVVVAVGVWNAPIPGVRARYREAAGPAYRLVNLDQYWSYFSPEVGLVSTDFWVEIERIDGTTERWDRPEDFPVFGTFRRYRWLKYDEFVGYGEDAEPIFDFVVRDIDDPGTVTELHLVVAFTAPTIGQSGPYEPNWESQRIAHRTLGIGS